MQSELSVIFTLYEALKDIGGAVRLCRHLGRQRAQEREKEREREIERGGGEERIREVQMKAVSLLLSVTVI